MAEYIVDFSNAEDAEFPQEKLSSLLEQIAQTPKLGGYWVYDVDNKSMHYREGNRWIKVGDTAELSHYWISHSIKDGIITDYGPNGVYVSDVY